MPSTRPSPTIRIFPIPLHTSLLILIRRWPLARTHCINTRPANTFTIIPQGRCHRTISSFYKPTIWTIPSHAPTYFCPHHLFWTSWALLCLCFSLLLSCSWCLCQSCSSQFPIFLYSLQRNEKLMSNIYVGRYVGG